MIEYIQDGRSAASPLWECWVSGGDTGSTLAQRWSGTTPQMGWDSIYSNKYITLRPDFSNWAEVCLRDKTLL